MGTKLHLRSAGFRSSPTHPYYRAWTQPLTLPCKAWSIPATLVLIAPMDNESDKVTLVHPPFLTWRTSKTRRWCWGRPLSARWTRARSLLHLKRVRGLDEQFGLDLAWIDV